MEEERLDDCRNKQQHGVEVAFPFRFILILGKIDQQSILMGKEFEVDTAIEYFKRFLYRTVL